MQKLFIVCSVTMTLVLLSCVEKEFDLDAVRTPRDYSIEEARDVEVIYSDSAVLRVKIEGPLLRRYVYRFRVEEEFPEGVVVNFFDTNARPTAWLSAKYAIRKPQEHRTHRTIVRDSVVLHNTLGEKIEGLELIWDENEETIYTDKFVKITRPDEIIYSRGFKSNQDFTKYTLYAVEGEMLFEELGPKDDN
jgi:LPS export ABC transporter protein LptC